MIYLYKNFCFNLRNLVSSFFGFAPYEISHDLIIYKFKFYPIFKYSKILNCIFDHLNNLIIVTDKKKSYLIKKKIIDIIIRLPKLSIQNYFYLYRYLILLGEFEIAYLVKKKILKIYYKGSTKIFFKTYYLKKITKLILFENQNYKILKKKINLSFFQSKEEKKINNLFNLILFKKNKKKIFNKKNKFYYLVNNKKIAIFCKNKNLEYKNLKKFDTIIRIGSAFKKNFDPNRNKKTDIIYFNHAHIQNVNLKYLLKKYDIISVKSNIPNKKIINLNDKKIRYVDSIDFNYFGSLNMLFVILLDLFFYNTKSIKIFDATLFLPYRNKIYNASEKKILQSIFNYTKEVSFYLHDPFLQFNLLKYILSAKHLNVKCDQILKSIIFKGEKNFAQKMDKFHSLNQKIYIKEKRMKLRKDYN